MTNLVSPKHITELKSNEIFVFGSNIEGRHSAGAAKKAMQWGAVYGQGEGLYGNTYAIPTRKYVKGKVNNGIGVPHYNKPYNSSIITISLAEIVLYVYKFLIFAELHKHKIFLVTEIGCGNAGYTPIMMAPLFKDAKKLDNVLLPLTFIDALKEII